MTTNQIPIQNDEWANIALCPLCGGDYLHFDEIQMGGREPAEDGDAVDVIVDNRGRVFHDDRRMVPCERGTRRHYIALVGDCEQCDGHFAYVLTQHKGQTFFDVEVQDWRPVTP